MAVAVAVADAVVSWMHWYRANAFVCWQQTAEECDKGETDDKDEDEDEKQEEEQEKKRSMRKKRMEDMLIPRHEIGMRMCGMDTNTYII